MSGFRQIIDKIGFRARIRLGMVLVIMFVMAFSVSASVYLQSRNQIVSMNRLGSFIALNLSHNSKLGVLSEEPENLKQPLDAVLRENQVMGAAVYLPDGRLISYKKRRQYLLNIGLEEQLNLVRSSSEPVFVKKVLTNSALPVAVYFAKVIIEKTEDEFFGVSDARSEMSGFVRVDMSLSQLSERKAMILYQNLLLMPVYILIGLVLSILVEKRISKPLTELKTAAMRIANGDFSSRIEVGSQDEIGSLASAFNNMSRQLYMVMKELNDANSSLEKANAELQDFTYIVSHDLQEPLRKLHSFAQFLVEDFGDEMSDEGKDYVDRMQRAVVRMKGLIKDLLKLSRIGTAEELFEPVDATDAVKKALDDLSVAVEESGAEVVFGQLPVVSANGTQMVQVFENLVGNAIKYRSDERTPKIEIGAKSENGRVLFWVRDNGIGIENQYLEKIFGVFQRLYNKSRYEGTGIGLALCKKIIQRHGGEIWAESAVGVGTTFYFTLQGSAVNAGGIENDYEKVERKHSCITG